MAVPRISRNESGLTLIELLMSITLLGIILVAFMGFFTQNAIFIQSNQKKLTTSEEAQKLVQKVEMKIDNNKLRQIGIIDDAGVIKSNIGTSSYRMNSPELETILLEPLDASFEITVELKNFSKNPKLIQAKITVKDKEKPTNYSETYTFIKG